jgi:hypothetical protein
VLGRFEVAEIPGKQELVLDFAGGTRCDLKEPGKVRIGVATAALCDVVAIEEELRRI